MAIEEKSMPINPQTNVNNVKERVKGRVSAFRPQIRAKLQPFQTRGQGQGSSQITNNQNNRKERNQNANNGNENDYDGGVVGSDNTMIQEIGILLSARGRQMAGKNIFLDRCLFNIYLLCMCV